MDGSAPQAVGGGQLRRDLAFLPAAMTFTLPVGLALTLTIRSERSLRRAMGLQTPSPQVFPQKSVLKIETQCPAGMAQGLRVNL